MGYLIFTIFFSMWELFCYVFYLYAQHNVLSYRLSYALPVGGGGIRVCAHSPPPWKVFFSLYGGYFCYFFFMWEPSATFISLCISLYVLGLQIMLCPPPGRKNVRKRPSHGIKIAKKFRVNSKIEKKRNNACALVKKRLR